MSEIFDTCMHPEAKALLDVWRSLSNGGSLPSQPLEIETTMGRWLHDISIVELHAGPRFFVRYHGENTQLRVGDNMTNLYFEDVLQPIVRLLALAPYEEAMRQKLPTRSTMVPKLYRGVFAQLDRLVLPFGEAQEVTSFVTWVGPTDKCASSTESLYDNLSALTDPMNAAKDMISLRVLTV